MDISWIRSFPVLENKALKLKNLYLKNSNNESRAHVSPFMSIIRVIVMMLGETDGIGSFVNPYTEGNLHFGPMSIFFLILFIFLVPILLTNLLIGLAVGDIEVIFSF